MYGLSSVAGIIDRDGNVRTVVTEHWRFRFHINAERGERLFVVPGLLVREPVDWGLIPFVIASAEQAVADGIWPRPMLKRGVPEWEAEQLLGRRIMRQEAISRAA